MVILFLYAVARPWKPISWSSRWTIIVLMLLPKAIRNSLVCVATESRQFLCAMCVSTGWSRSVSLCGLPLSGWAVVAPKRFHFTITALTISRGSSSSAGIWRTELLERCHPMIVPCWKPLSSSVRPFYCQYLSMAIAWLCAQFYTTVSNGCGWNWWIR
jgi:hypothetical protein